MSFVYSIDGISLADPMRRWWVTAEGSSHSQGVALRSVAGVVPGMPGIPDVGYEPREAVDMNLRVMVQSRVPNVREMYWEAVKALFATGSSFVLGRSVEGIARTTRAKLRSISQPELHARTGSLVGVITITMLDGLFHGPESDFEQPLAGNISGQLLPRLGGTAPVEDWVIRVQGPIGSVNVSDDTTGTGVAFSGAILATEYLYLRGADGRKSTSPSAWDSGGIDVSGSVTIPPAGLLRLTPRPIRADPMMRAARWSVTRSGSTSATRITLRGGAAYA